MIERMSDANAITKAYMDSILIEERLIDSVTPELELEFLGEKFSTPIMTPAFSHLPKYNGRGESGLIEYAKAARECGALNWCGMMENDMFYDIAYTGAKTVRIVKPYENRDKILDQLSFAAENGAFAVGVDIDHIFGANGYDVVYGERMAPQSASQLRELCEYTKLPFVVKGVLSVQDAVKCADIGAKVIVVSHHHGRLPYALPPLMILPYIKDALKGSGVRIVVDCGIESGADAYKALALGADAVSVGRAMLPSLEQGGVAGMCAYLDKIKAELVYIMGFTGFASLSDMDSSALWLNGKPL